MKKSKVYLVPFVRVCESKKDDRWIRDQKESTEKRTRRVQLVLPPSLYNAAMELAEEEGISFTEFAIRALSWQCNIYEEVRNVDDDDLPPWEF